MGRDVNNSEDWSNDETWIMRRWMINEPENTRFWQESAKALLDDENLFKDQRERSNALAQEMREEAETYCSYYCCSYSSLASDLLELALARVNWLELADELFLDFHAAQTEKE